MERGSLRDCARQTTTDRRAQGSRRWILHFSRRRAVLFLSSRSRHRTHGGIPLARAV